MPDHDLPPDTANPSGPATDDAPMVVGIGASAGGLAALKTFFAEVPADNGLAWVVVVHLSPEHESHLAELLQPHVQMPIEQVTETVRLEANHVYVIPPNANLSTIDTHLRLSELEERRRERAPIDHFFRTLARTHDGHAVGVILTGTGSDGTLGLREIKEKGGLTVVQDPGDAEYDGMPRSAIATGLVDVVVPLADIPGSVLGYARTRPRLTVAELGEDAEAGERRLLQLVFAQIRTRTRRDFSRYKRSTVLRRVARRMQIRRLEELDQYLELLRTEADEVQALADDLLITVTSFFRDPEVFEALEKEVVPALMEGREADETVRVWSVGCATGEEAYSLTMLLMEAVDRQDAPPRIQVFASDLHDQSLQKARDGFYPGDIATDVTPERLKRFFIEEDGGYRIRREVREMVVFSPHNLLGDPPFSRVDLVSCRNVLIYLDREVQRDVMDIFHYSLRGDGFLVLGGSETVEARELFHVEDKKHCIYRRRGVPGPHPKLPVFPLAGSRGAAERQRGVDAGPVGYGRMHQQIIERFGPPSILVSPDDGVVHLSQNAGRYLTHPGGGVTSNVYMLVPEELRIELRSALHEARKRQSPVQTGPQTVRLNGESVQVVMDVRPALDPAPEGYAVVLFAEREQGGGPEAAVEQEGVQQRAAVERGGKPEEVPPAELAAELQQSRERLQSIIQDHETTQEELRASNEELQSTNEELLSTMEELETSKEELQSINEELQTVNQENRHKVEELSQLSGDLQNLMASTEIATLFLDCEGRIMRYTPKVAELFNVRPADRGRPLGDLTHRLQYDDLERDIARVLERLIPVEREIQDSQDQWYLTRVLAYRSTEDRIEGVVVTFVDITDRKRAEVELQRARKYAESIVETLHEPLLVLDPDLRVRKVNPAFYEQFAVRADDTVGRLIYDLGNGQWDIPELRTLLEEVLPDSDVFNDYEVRHTFQDIGERVMLLNARRLDHVQLILLGIRDITERTRAEDAVRDSEARQAFLLTLSDALRPLADPVEIQAAAARILGEHLGADRAYYVEIDESADEFVVARDWHQPGVASHASRYPLGDWPMPWVLDGRTWVVRDTDTDPAMPDDQREVYRGNDVGAAVVVPLIKEGRLVATFVANQRAPRAWTPQEIDLAEGTAERTWATVERARAEEALRESREQLERELADTRSLQRISSRLIGEEGTGDLHEELLEAAIALLRADMASIQVLDPEGETLHLVAWKGFHPDSAAYWATVDRTTASACGGALSRGERLIVPDVDTAEFLEGTKCLEHYHLSGISALQSTPLISRDGNIVGMISTHWRAPHVPTEREWGLFDALARQAADIIERKRGEEALRASEERYRTLFESMDEGFCVIEMLFDEAGEPADYRFIEANPAFEQQTGLTEALGRRMREMVPDHEEHWFRVYGRIAMTGEAKRFVEEARGLGGRWYDVYAFRIGEPEARRVAVLFNDITKQKETELALRRSEIEFRALIQASMDAVYRMSPDWSEMRLLQGRGLVPDTESPTTSWLEQYIHPDDQPEVLEAIQEAIRTSSVFELEHRVRRGDGTMTWMVSRAVPILNEDGEITEWIGAATDVTERREWQDKLERRVAERTREVRELAETLSVAEQEERQRLSHLLHDDLQQLLYGVQLKVSLARDHAQREDLEGVMAQTERSLKLLDDAITLTRQLTVDLNPPILDGEGLVGAIEWLRTQMRDLHGLNVEIEAVGEIEVGPADLRILLFQITRELLFNVAKHAGVDRAVVEVVEEDGWIRVTVADEGKGVDHRVLDTRGARRGGLGLFSARERLRLRGGDLKIESLPGEGSRFVAYAPGTSIS